MQKQVEYAEAIKTKYPEQIVIEIAAGGGFLNYTKLRRTVV
ncbi:MAG: hypothetical protein ACYSUY_03265 [Planctomycetota bacterium]